jgi:hypothetical protein
MLAATVQITRTGTIAGINQYIVIGVDGAWNMTNRVPAESARGGSPPPDSLRFDRCSTTPR